MDLFSEVLEKRVQINALNPKYSLTYINSIGFLIINILDYFNVFGWFPPHFFTFNCDWRGGAPLLILVIGQIIQSRRACYTSVSIFLYKAFLCSRVLDRFRYIFTSRKFKNLFTSFSMVNDVEWCCLFKYSSMWSASWMLLIIASIFCNIFFVISLYKWTICSLSIMKRLNLTIY